MMRLPFKPLLIAGAVLTAPLLGACHGNVGADDKGSKVEFTMKNGSLTLRKRIVIVKVSGHDPAYITTHGHLVIGSTNADEVPTNDEQRAALAAYNKAANGMIDKGIDVGVEGAHVAADAIGIVIKDAVNGKTQDIDKDVKKGVEPIKGKVDQLCNQLDTWRQAQADVARLIPVFEPYAIIGDADIKDCHEHGFIDDDDNAGDKDKNADKDSDDEDDDDSDKPSSPGDAVHDSIQKSNHESLSNSLQESVNKSGDTSGDTAGPPAAAPAAPAPAEVAPPPKTPDAPASPPAKGLTGGSTKKSLTV